MISVRVMDRYPFPTHPRNVPDPAYAHRRAKDPAGDVQLPSGDVVALTTTYQDAAVVLTDPRFSRNLLYEGAPKMYDGYNLTEAPGSIMTLDPPEHTRLRRLLAGTFTPRQVEAWRPRVRAIVLELLDDLPPTFDFVHDFAFPLPVQVICDVMGVPGIDTASVREWTTAMLSTTSMPVERKAAAAAAFYAYAGEIIAEHRDSPGDGLLASMILARDEGDRLSEHELTRLTLGMFLAGHETTGSVLTKGMFRLLDGDRSGWEALVATPELIPAAVEELLRLDGAGESPIIRVAKEDVELPSGTVVPKGKGVIASFIGAAYDPEAFPDPMTMKLDRQGQPPLAFGRGPHYCLGANLARMELQETYATLVEAVPGLRLAGDPDDLVWTEGTLLHRPDTMQVTRQ